MGRTHALTGVAGWLACVPAVQQVSPLTGREIVAGVIVTAGAAMLPDLDHPSGTAARSFGPITRLASRLVVAVFGPHRHGTHSWFFAGLTLVLGGAAGVAGGWWVAVPVFLAATLAIGVLMPGSASVHGRDVARAVLRGDTRGIRRGLRNEAAAAALGYAAFTGDVGTAWLGLALGLGCLMHVLGDRLTPEGQALWWPIDKRLVPGLGWFTTDTWREGVFALVVTVAIGVLSLGTVAGWDYLSAAVQVAAA